MIIDTSAILAILFGEPDAARYAEAIAMAWPRRMSVAAPDRNSHAAEGNERAHKLLPVSLLLLKELTQWISVEKRLNFAGFLRENSSTFVNRSKRLGESKF
ncbi:MAG: type II toxin-antitoxin system VapC family toxin [Caldilineaceae bacterium]|nr:type II toxin-antitoxin system VapC family toxin [Caldilineaceae bacterium]